MKSKNSLFSFAKAKENLVAVALAAVLMAANTTVALAQNKATASNGTENTIEGVDKLYGVDPSAEHCTDTKVGTNQTDGNRIRVISQHILTAIIKSAIMKVKPRKVPQNTRTRSGR